MYTYNYLYLLLYLIFLHHHHHHTTMDSGSCHHGAIKTAYQQNSTDTIVYEHDLNSLLPPIISAAIVDLYIMLTSLHMECHKIQHTVLCLACIAGRKAGAGFKNYITFQCFANPVHLPYSTAC